LLVKIGENGTVRKSYSASFDSSLRTEFCANMSEQKYFYAMLLHWLSSLSTLIKFYTGCQAKCRSFSRA